jgi:Tfp pilus assembly protein PilV
MHTLIGRHRQRGVSLIEALIAFVVMAFGMVATIGMQSTLRFNGDVAKQRAEAVRLAQEEMEKLRAFSVIDTTPGKHAFADLTTTITQDSGRCIDDGVFESCAGNGVDSNTSFQTSREVIRTTEPDLVMATVTVSWADRQGNNQSVVLRSAIAGIDPALSGRLSVPPAGVAMSRPLGRELSIPLWARDFGDGRSGFVPPGSANSAWVFDNSSGWVTSVCQVPSGTTNATLTATVLTTCTGTHAALLSGHVRFALGSGPLTAADAENPDSPGLDLDVSFKPTLGSVGSPPCYDDSASATTQTVVRYFCLITPDATTLKWSGRPTFAPLGWTFAAVSPGYRLCRYTAATASTWSDRLQGFVNVAGNLANQNFLLIRSGATALDNPCPTDVAADPIHGDFVDSSTVEYSPS